MGWTEFSVGKGPASTPGGEGELCPVYARIQTLDALAGIRLLGKLPMGPKVQPADRRSNKSPLIPPTPGEVAKLAQLSRNLPSDTAPKEQLAAPHRSIRRRLTPEAVDELVARYTAGENTPALSREFGISESALRDLLRAEGVSLRGHAITPEDVEKAVCLYESGLTITRVAAEVGYSHGTIRTALLKHGAAIRVAKQRKGTASSE